MSNWGLGLCGRIYHHPSSTFIARVVGGGKGCSPRVTRTRVDRFSERTGVPLGSGSLGVGATSAKGNKRYPDWKQAQRMCHRWSV